MIGGMDRVATCTDAYKTEEEGVRNMWDLRKGYAKLCGCQHATVGGGQGPGTPNCRDANMGGQGPAGEPAVSGH